MCDKKFDEGKASKIYCSKDCNDSLEPKRLSDPKRFFQSLLNPTRVADGLTANDLLDVLSTQEGLCALTGRKMTFIRGSGQVDTNVSIDRIEAGGAYKKENIQLVCSAVNSFRRNLPLNVFIEWCSEVAEHNKAKGGRH